MKEQIRLLFTSPIRGTIWLLNLAFCMTRMPVTLAADIKQEVLATINAHNKF